MLSFMFVLLVEALVFISFTAGFLLGKFPVQWKRKKPRKVELPEITLEDDEDPVSPNEQRLLAKLEEEGRKHGPEEDEED